MRSPFRSPFPRSPADPGRSESAAVAPRRSALAAAGRTAAWLGLLALLTLALRAADCARVFPGDGVVELAPADSALHARRALYSFANFPAVLTFDPYMAWPDGARVPMPPLYDWALGGVARLFGDSEAVFERVVAWASPVFAALTVFPVYAVARSLGGRGLGLGAALLFAWLPVGARRAMLGDVDHHAAVAFLGACWLAQSLTLLRPDPVRARALAARAAGLALVRAGLLLSWSGSILYLALGEGALLLAIAVDGRRRLLVAQAAGAAAAALPVAGWLLVSPPSVPFTAVDLSWLHVLVLLGLAACEGVLALLRRAWDEAGPARRLGLAAALGLAIAGVALLVAPGLAEELGTGLRFLGKEDTWGARNLEQQALFSAPLREGARSLALVNYGWLAWLVPLVPLAVLAAARDAGRRSRALCAGCWATVLGTLAVAQVRFGSDFAPVAAVGFALLLHAVGVGVSGRVPGLRPVLVAPPLAALLLWPGLRPTFTPAARPPPEPVRDGERVVPLSPTLSHTRFARMIRGATPETAGYLDAEGRPEYAVLVRPSDGHTLHYLARRASPADNFGPYLDRGKYRAVQRFYGASSKAEALAVAARLGVRYVVTSARDAPDPAPFADRLHALDALVGPEAPAEHIRLVVEGPFAGVPQRLAFPSGPPPTREIPYKLFELVEGAVLEARLPPGQEMDVRVQVATNLGRRLPFRARSRADAGGLARVRVPYPTGTTAPTRTVGPYRVRVGDQELRVEVSEEDVRRGRTVPVVPSSLRPPAPPAPSSPARRDAVRSPG